MHANAISAFLLQVRSACRDVRVLVTLSAQQDAADMGWFTQDILTQLIELETGDFEKRVVSLVRPEDQVWVFCPQTEDGILWIRLVERSQLIVVSFHEK